MLSAQPQFDVSPHPPTHSRLVTQKQEEYEEDEDEYGEANAEGGLTGLSDKANGGGGGGEVDLLSMDDLTVSDPAPPAAAAGIGGGGGGIEDLFGGGSVGGVPAPQAVQKQVRRWFRAIFSVIFVAIWKKDLSLIPGRLLEVSYVATSALEMY